MDKKEEILRLFPGKLREILGQVPGNFEDIQEIRLRAGRPLLLVKGNEEFFLSLSGKPVTAIDRAVSITASQIRETVEYMGSYSLYAFEEEMRQGFITIQGGPPGRPGRPGSVGEQARSRLRTDKNSKIHNFFKRAYCP